MTRKEIKNWENNCFDKILDNENMRIFDVESYWKLNRI